MDFCSPQKAVWVDQSEVKKLHIPVKRNNGVVEIRIENLALDHIQPEKIQYHYPLFFIHGAGGTSQSWKNYLPYFAANGWEVYALNLRGHFPSDPEETLAQVTIENYLEDMQKVIRHLQIQHCVLIGHSLGGLLAQKMAENMTKVKALITMASAPPFGIVPDVHQNLPYFGVMLETMWTMINLEPIKPTFPLAEKTALSNIEPDKQKTVFNMFVPESLMVGYQVSQGYPVYAQKIACRKLVIGCAKDVIAPPSMQRRLADLLGADYLEYEQFGHLPMLEKGWMQSSEDIRNWLKKNVKDE